MKNENIITFVRMTALFSFLGGTAIFLLYQFNPGFHWMQLGALYILLAALVNSLVLLFALIQSAIYSKEGPKLFFNSLLMLLNIPVVIIYIALL